MDRNALARATEGTDAPTPGYLYVDLAKAAASNPSACSDMARYLTNRLSSKNNPNIKAKCCKVIAKLCDNVPRNQFRRCISQDPSATAAIKEAMQYRGTPDPVRGDEPNQRVRTAAKEALDAVYREQASSEMAAAPHAGISSSYAPSPHGGGPGSYGGPSAMGGGGGGGNRMQGIGNPRYNDPRMDPRYNGAGGGKIKDVVKEAGEVVLGMIKDPLARNVGMEPPRQGHSGNLPGYGSPGPGQPGGYGRPPPGQSELMRQTGGQWTMASNVGPGAIQYSPNYGGSVAGTDYSRDNTHSAPHNSAASGTVGGSWGSVVATQPSSTAYGTPSITIQSNGMPSGGGGVAVSDGNYEKSLIMELCPPGGMKPVPPPDKLANFSRAVPSLNSDLICPVLLDLLEEGQPWIIRAKALCVMEVSIQSGAKPDGTNAYKDFFYACNEEIAPLSQHPRSAIKEPARRVLTLLGLPIPSGGAVSAAPVAAAAPAPNLLDFDDAPVPPPAAPPPPPSAPPPPPPSDAGGSSLFGGMQVKAGTAAPPPAAAPPAAPQSGNLLDFGAPPPAAADIFRPPAETTPAQASNMFADMSLKGGEDKKTDSEDAGDSMPTAPPAPPPGGSAFGFINASSSTEEPPVPAAAPMATAVSSDSFDPLKNMTPNTAQRKVMQMSQEQMQAMAYQQMMMQQQTPEQMQAMAYQMMMQQQMMQKQMQAAMAGGGRPAGVPLYTTGGRASAVSSGFSFVDTKPAKKDDKKFDFVKDAMQASKTK